MLGFADRRRAPFPARAVAARLEHAPAVEFDAQQHVHLLEPRRDRRIVAHLDLAEQLLHLRALQLRVREGADAHLAVEQRARGRVLQREFAGEAGRRARPVDVGHGRRGEHHAADRGGGGNLRVQLEPGGDAEVGAELAREHFDGVTGLDDAERGAAPVEHFLAPQRVWR